MVKKMSTYVHRYFFLIILLCVLTEILAPNPTRLRSSKTKTHKNHATLFQHMTSLRHMESGPKPAAQVFKPSSSELDQIKDVIDYDTKAADFIRRGSPSFNQQIIQLSQRVKDVEAAITKALAAESTTGEIENIPMSKAIVEQTLKLSENQIKALEERTRTNNEELYAERGIRLTADLFGSICLADGIEAMNVWMTSPRANPDAPRDEMVLKAMREELKLNIKPAGLYVDKNRGYLAALPDGTLEGVQKKVVKMHILQQPGKGKVPYKWIRAQALSPNKPLYHEIQGLLAITDREYCELIVVTRSEMKQVTVRRNRDFWENEMLPKLENFYMNVLLPKLSAEELPRINDIRKAAALLYSATLDFTRDRVKKIMSITEDEDDAYETLILESRMRMLSKHFYVAMDDTKSPKEKMREILEQYPINKDEWKFERQLKWNYVKSYAEKNNLQVELDGLIIDRTNRFLAALPSALGRKRPGVYYRANRKKKGLKDPDIIFEVVTPAFWFKNNDAKKPARYILKDLDFMEKVDTGKESKYVLRKDSKHYFKIQGSLAITRLKRCIFMVAVPGRRDSYTETIEFDPDFWSNMLEKLKHFYFGVWLIYHASPTEFDRIFSGPDLKNLRRYPSVLQHPPAGPSQTTKRGRMKRTESGWTREKS